ncbi:hypothetical protein [Paracoccus sp. J39]|uniref:hypothetical protein n=1 Tax=Paracoccus sp. J39 TaxID=935848 RepID=UPI001E5053D3|nr:hypothetical protein [Paracoccus sp. J39]
MAEAELRHRVAEEAYVPPRSAGCECRACPPRPDAIGWCDERRNYLGIEAFRTEIASGMPAGPAVKLLGEAALLVPGGEQRSFQYRLPRHVDPDRARVYRFDRQRIERG